MTRQMTLLRLKNALLRRRRELRSSQDWELDELVASPATVGDSVDSAVETEHGEVCSLLGSNASHELEQVESALRRMELGRYGVCDECGKNIPVVRMQAIPESTRCVACQRLADRVGWEPVPTDFCGGEGFAEEPAQAAVL